MQKKMKKLQNMWVSGPCFEIVFLIAVKYCSFQFPQRLKPETTTNPSRNNKSKHKSCFFIGLLEVEQLLQSKLTEAATSWHGHCYQI